MIWRTNGEVLAGMTQEIDGHDHLAIIRAIDKAKNSRQPSVIIAHTIPGRGVDFMEYDYHWHGKSPNAEESGAGACSIE